MFRLPTKRDLSYPLEAAVRVDDAVGGTIQMATGPGDTLRIIEHRGLNDAYFERYAKLSATAGTSCVQSWLERRRIVVRDVLSDTTFEPHRDAATSAGYRAVQSTPLVDSEFRTVGILSTYFAESHHPGPDSLAAIDRYCRIAALIIEVDGLHEQIADADRRLSIPARALPGPVADAAGAARRLLPTLERPKHDAAARTATEHLEAVARHLRTMAHQTRGYAAARTLLSSM
jgi:GAF domain-containing protein